LKDLLKAIAYVSLGLAILTLVYFPYDIDRPLDGAEIEKTREYYAEAYKKEPAAPEAPASEFETRYIEVATRAAKDFDIDGQVRSFAEKFELQGKRVLDIGSGRGYLQDIVDDYTGLDISSNVGRFYHKKFVLGSATAMPFEDNTFDGAWSIWVQEHVPNPEQFLREARRVVKNNGVIFLLTAWRCSPWASRGYAVREYRALGLTGKMIKASIPIVSKTRDVSLVPIRWIREVAAAFAPTTLHYQRLTPNYDVYWEPDSDAINSIDEHEALLWFTSRGDECLNCDTPAGSVFMYRGPLIIRVHK